MDITCPGVPEGFYDLEYLGAEPQPENKERGFKPGINWKFVVIGGDYDAQLTSRITGSDCKPGVNAGEFFEKIVGRQPAPGIKVNLNDFAGKRFKARVKKAPSGKGTRVEELISEIE